MHTSMLMDFILLLFLFDFAFQTLFLLTKAAIYFFLPLGYSPPPQNSGISAKQSTRTGLSPHLPKKITNFTPESTKLFFPFEQIHFVWFRFQSFEMGVLDFKGDTLIPKPIKCPSELIRIVFQSWH